MPIHQSSLFGIDIGQDDMKTVQTGNGNLNHQFFHTIFLYTEEGA
jgi:hypothetical protein